MDALIQFLIDWGYVGLFLAALLAGSAIPFSSEVVLSALLLPGVDKSPIVCIIVASLGNLIGTLTCYWMGRLGKMEWLEKYFKLKPEKIERTRQFLNGKGVWFAFFSWVPIIGALIAAALGFMRTNIYAVSLIMLFGKMVRYIVWVMISMGLLSTLA